MIPGLGRSPEEGKGYALEWAGEFHGLYGPWGSQELDATERLSLHSLPYMTFGKTIALTIQTLCQQSDVLLFNTLPRFVIAFLLRSKRLLISWLQSPSTVILEPKKIKSVSLHVFPICFRAEGFLSFFIPVLTTL